MNWLLLALFEISTAITQTIGVLVAYIFLKLYQSGGGAVKKIMCIGGGWNLLWAHVSYWLAKLLDAMCNVAY